MQSDRERVCMYCFIGEYIIDTPQNDVKYHE